MRFVALSEVDLEHLGRSAELARKAIGEAPFGAILIGADGRTAATSVRLAISHDDSRTRPVTDGLGQNDIHLRSMNHDGQTQHRSRARCIC